MDFADTEFCEIMRDTVAAVDMRAGRRANGVSTQNRLAAADMMSARVRAALNGWLERIEATEPGWLQGRDGMG